MGIIIMLSDDDCRLKGVCGGCMEYSGTAGALDAVDREGVGGGAESPVNDNRRVGKVDAVAVACTVCVLSIAGADSGISASDDALLNDEPLAGAGIEGGAGSTLTSIVLE